MGFFDFWKRDSRPETKNYTILDLANEVGWPTTPGITPTTSLQSITVMRCVGLLGGLLASFPVDVLKKVGKTSQDVENSQIWRIFNVKANPENDATLFRWVMNANLLLSGNAVATKVMDGKRVVGLWPVRHEYVTFDRLKNGERVYKIRQDDGQQREYSMSQVYHEALWSLDGYVGLSPIAQAKGRIKGHISAEQLQTAIYENKPMPGMVVKYKLDLNEEKRKKIEEQLKAGFAGYMAGRPAVFGSDPAIDFPTIPLTDIQWLESIQAGEEQIAQMFGIPPHALGILRKTTSWGSGIEQLNIGFLQYTIQSLLTLKESAMRCQLMTEEEIMAKQFVRHNFDALLRADSKARAEAISARVQGGVLMPNEARALDDLAPVDGGDQLYMQQQMIPLDSPLRMEQPAQEAPPPPPTREMPAPQPINVNLDLKTAANGNIRKTVTRDEYGRVTEVMTHGE